MFEKNVDDKILKMIEILMMFKSLHHVIKFEVILPLIIIVLSFVFYLSFFQKIVLLLGSRVYNRHFEILFIGLIIVSTC